MHSIKWETGSAISGRTLLQDNPCQCEGIQCCLTTSVQLNGIPGSTAWKDELREKQTGGEGKTVSRKVKMEGGSSVANRYMESNSNVSHWRNRWSWWLLMCLSNVVTPLRMFPGEIELDDHPFRFLASMDFMNPMEQPIRSYRPISRMFACLPLLFLEMTSSQLKKKKASIIHISLSFIFNNQWLNFIPLNQYKFDTTVKFLLQCKMYSLPLEPETLKVKNIGGRLP